ncbi:TetR/AcrR family transcriptional regulator [Brevibacillus migulae]|uniref:TetR/AcrR family transcriptional regulator n=1 Tax=Brevibacillus migulae TaxID=1644114 RepID=UPI00106EC21A|nr:TetR/AcrR family transcriptional regulator [Brevibacillus migulae]
MKQEERRQQTTQLILESTKALIQEKGCHSITMKDIMEKSGLSKGAIFHYLKSKDEIFAWVLQERLAQINERFLQEVEHGNKTFAGPMQAISESLHALEDPDDVTNRVLMYLLGKEDQPVVAEALRQFYAQSVAFSKEWIMAGQRHGVIPASVDTDRTAELFVLLSIGLRVRSSVPIIDSSSFQARDFASFITSVLQPPQ